MNEVTKPTALDLATEQKKRVSSRLATYRKLATGADFGADLEAVLAQGEANVETAFAGFVACEPHAKSDLDEFYDVTFGVLESVSLVYTDLLESSGKTTLRALVLHEETPPKELLPDAAQAREYFIHTSQEIDVLSRSACDGRTGQIWRDIPQRQARIYEPHGASHRVELTLRDADPGATLSGLESLTNSQDADFVLTMLYVASVLAPPSPLPPNRYAGDWIDLADVMEKIGWYPSKLSKEKATELRARLWRYLVYGDRAVVVGARTASYVNKATGEALPTRVDSAIWRIMSIERLEKEAALGDVPARVEIVISKEWEPLLTSARLAQYLPLGELLGSIPPNKVAGDWARSVGLVLASLWRRKPRETVAGTIKPTRRELLTTYTPKTRTVEELLATNKPRRAVEYWRDALGILVERGFIASKGEAALSVAQMLKDLPAYSWQSQWLDAPVSIAPGPKMQAPVIDRAQALPTLKPKALPGKRRGRPRKSQPV